MLRADEVPDLADGVHEQFSDRIEDPADDPRDRLVQHGGVKAWREAPEQYQRNPPEDEAHEGHRHPGDDHALPPPLPLLAQPPPQPVKAEELGDDHQREADEGHDEGAQDQVREGTVGDQEPADAGREHAQEQNGRPVNRPVGQTPDGEPTDDPEADQHPEPGREDRPVERGASEGSPVGEVVATPHRNLVHEGQEQPQGRETDEAEGEGEDGEAEPLNEPNDDHDRLQ